MFKNYLCASFILISVTFVYTFLQTTLGHVIQTSITKSSYFTVCTDIGFKTIALIVKTS